ncbi:MAG TPA: amidohydrolase family protein, partial [Chloroflexota bacterium]|nr:amidohydrolase family protein [Chloroflexota bacterium]
MPLAERIAAARGGTPADLVLKRGRVVNVFTGELLEADVAVHDGHVVGLGEYAGRAEIDLDGALVTPGLIDGHLHVESTMLSPGELARALVPRGVTAVVVDPHEIANVLGAEGVRLMVAASEGLPLDVYFMLPSCVPASEMESAAARLGAEELAPLLGLPRVLGIGEVMDFPRVLAADPALLAKIGLSERVDGHAPGVRGRELAAYLTAGVESDHETVDPAEAEERLRLGMWLMLREGSPARNLEALLPVVRRLGARRALLVTDDVTPIDLRDHGAVDHAVRLAIRQGVDPAAAVAMGSLNAAERFGLRRVGAVAPGYRADLVVSASLEAPRPRLVLKGGRVVARDGEPLFEPPEADWTAARGTVRIGPLDATSFRLPAGDSLSGENVRDVRNVRRLRDVPEVRAIGLVPGQIVTEALVVAPSVRGGAIVADPARDLMKLAVVERHRATGRIGLGLVRGFGLRAGALVSSVAHDAHNLVVSA